MLFTSSLRPSGECVVSPLLSLPAPSVACPRAPNGADDGEKRGANTRSDAPGFSPGTEETKRRLMVKAGDRKKRTPERRNGEKETTDHEKKQPARRRRKRRRRKRRRTRTRTRQQAGGRRRKRQVGRRRGEGAMWTVPRDWLEEREMEFAKRKKR
uniref:Uncharacterized protein n=1 Tax=Toxoplasma gondii TgCATBr9 TaxID=943120 RepID=A0A2T6IFA3_TOXGO|nr:hypothetical protein TGBR9_384700 [Toxoplasma gondii TgCATBr9]